MHPKCITSRKPVCLLHATRQCQDGNKLAALPWFCDWAEPGKDMGT